MTNEKAGFRNFSCFVTKFNTVTGLFFRNNLSTDTIIVLGES